MPFGRVFNRRAVDGAARRRAARCLGRARLEALETRCLLTAVTGELAGPFQPWAVFGPPAAAESPPPVAIDAAWLSQRGPGPYYLSAPGTTYVLETDVQTPGSGFVVTADDVTLDLNGHRLTYDAAPRVLIPNGDFEEGTGSEAPGWNLASAPDAEFISGTYVQPVQVFSGFRALSFPASAPDQWAASTAAVTLAANTTYELSLMTYNPPDTPNVANRLMLYAELEGTAIRATSVGYTQRGYQRAAALFTTGPAGGSYFVRAGLRDADPLTPEGSKVYIDDVRIQRYGSQGVLVGPASYEAHLYPDVTQFGAANGVAVRNGTIVQGTGDGSSSHGIYLNGGAGCEVAGVQISVHGPDARNVYGVSCRDVILRDSRLQNDVTIISSRDALDGSAITLRSAAGARIAGNTVLGGCQNGITLAAGDGLYPAEVTGNTISLRSRYTNGFAVQLVGGVSGSVHHNIIDNASGNYTGRGVGMSSGVRQMRVYDNVISVRGLPLIQEYNGSPWVGAYGIQVESAADVEIDGNQVTAFAAQTAAAAFRMNPAASTANVSVHNNVFRAIAAGADFPAAAVKIDDLAGSDSLLRFTDNTLETNSRWLEGRAVSALALRRSTLAIAALPVLPFEPLVAANWDNNPNSALRGAAFVDNRYADAASRAAFEGASIQKKFYNTQGVDPDSYFFCQWSVAVRVVDPAGQPIPGADVAIERADFREALRATTDAQGRAAAAVAQFRNYGGLRSDLTPSRLTVAAAGYQTQTQSLSVTTAQDLTVTLPLRAPAAAGPYRAVANRTLTVPAPGVLAGVAGQETGAATAVLVTGPLHGSLTLSPSGGFQYTPSADFCGSDSFAYRLRSGGSDGPLQTATILVNGITGFAAQNAVVSRSYIRYLDLTFGAADGLADLVRDGRLRLVHSGLDGTGGQIVPLDGLSQIAANRLRIDFDAEGILRSQNTKDADGRYVLAVDCDQDGIFESARSFSRLAGDANGDGRVSMGDFARVRAQFGQRGADLAGDLNGDGRVSLRDLSILLACVGRSLAPPIE